MRRTQRLGEAGAPARVPFALATSTVMARTTGGLFAMGGILGTVLSVLMPHDGPGNRLVVAVAAFGAVCFGLGLVVIGDRVRPSTHQILVVFGTILITVAVHQSTSNAAALSLASCYVFVACDSSFFFSWFRAAGQILFAVVCCMTVLMLRPELPWWSGLIPSGVTIAVGCVVGVLARLASDADIDSLTGLLNRRGFDRRLHLEIARATRTGLRPALILFDLDRFKTVNDELGHRSGDAVLQRVADQWQKLLGPTRILARYGGDEFALLVPDMSEQGAISLADQMREAIALGCSAGVTSWQPGESGSFLVSRADVGLYRAKQAGRNRTVLESSRRPPLAVELVEAIARETLEVQYQPIVSLVDDGQTVGVEALVRWQSLTQPSVTTEEVIRVAEENGLIGNLDKFVLYRACRDAHDFQNAVADRRLILNVNVSGLELVEKDYVGRVDEVLRATGWPAAQLVLEVTESVLDVNTPTAITNLTELRTRGIRIAIDDFGTGYSSLSRLKTLPTDFLKLDGSFITSITSEGEAPPLLEVIALLSTSLGLPVIAEGVENSHQAAVLTALGYSLAQGFYYGKPQSARGLIDSLGTPTSVGT
ncbi:putative bifunctional diguanylate cyclase/phosphodiesterase [Antrihabitans sp. NCIMB 15449]|uniref:Bifunctional diguanylate cyclase/phosphodiesterase n=1 Tax=Antrihabitans spumae TaxID=3373370 RepID=A0ABW7JKR4_9NOCA